MDEKDYLNPADQEFENALRHLSPTAGQIDPISAAFAAGKRSAQKRTHAWQSTSAMLLLLGFAVWFLPGLHQSMPDLAVEHLSPARWEEIEIATGNAPMHSLEPQQPLSDQSMAALERTVLDHGIDALPISHVPSQHPLNPDKL